MKRSLLLIPTIIASAATPMITLGSCVVYVGGGDTPEPTPPEPEEDWITWDFIKDGMFEKEIEIAPSTTSPTPEACNAAYFDWLAKDKNNIIYDYLLNISNNWGESYTEYWVSIKINNIDMENHLISFNFRSKKTKEYEESNEQHKIEEWYDVECINVEYIPIWYKRTLLQKQYWLIGSIISTKQDIVHDIWKDVCEPLIHNYHHWCTKGSYYYKEDGEVIGNIDNVNYDINNAIEAYWTHDEVGRSVVRDIGTLYDVFTCQSTFLSEVPQPS